MLDPQMVLALPVPSLLNTAALTFGRGGTPLVIAWLRGALWPRRMSRHAILRGM